MTVRNQLVITALAVCHLFAAVPLVTSQLPPSAPSTIARAAADDDADTDDAQDQPAASSSSLPITNISERGEPITIRAREQEKSGDLYTLRGDVEIEFRDMTLHADAITYNHATGNDRYRTPRARRRPAR